MMMTKLTFIEIYFYLSTKPKLKLKFWGQKISKALKSLKCKTSLL